MTGSSVDRPFYLYLAYSDKTLIVDSQQTVLQVLIDADVDIEPGCMLGSCGMCAADFVEGDLIHKDVCLNELDRMTMFCPCVSRAGTRIILPL